MSMMRRLSLAIALAALLPGCGSDTVTTPPAPPTPPPPVTTVIGEGSYNGLEPEGAAVASFPTNQAGDLEIVLDWTLAENDLDALLMRGECTLEQLIALQCDVVAIADGADKPERFGIPNAPAGTYTFYVINLGATTESFSFQILLTTVGTASASRTVSPPPARVDPARLVALARPKTVVRLP
jgi:hypothetical protein